MSLCSLFPLGDFRARETDRVVLFCRLLRLCNKSSTNTVQTHCSAISPDGHFDFKLFHLSCFAVAVSLFLAGAMTTLPRVLTQMTADMLVFVLLWPPVSRNKKSARLASTVSNLLWTSCPRVWSPRTLHRSVLHDRHGGAPRAVCKESWMRLAIHPSQGRRKTRRHRCHVTCRSVGAEVLEALRRAEDQLQNWRVAPRCWVRGFRKGPPAQVNVSRVRSRAQSSLLHHVSRRQLSAAVALTLMETGPRH